MELESPKVISGKADAMLSNNGIFMTMQVNFTLCHNIIKLAIDFAYFNYRRSKN